MGFGVVALSKMYREIECFRVDMPLILVQLAKTSEYKNIYNLS